MNSEKGWLEKDPCVLLQAGAEPEQSSGKEEQEGKGASVMENKVVKFWKKRRDVRKECRSTSRKREGKAGLLVTREERKRKSADCNVISAEINHL